MSWNSNLPQGNEAGKIKYDIVQYTRGRVLDLGSGPWKPFDHFISVDLKQEWSGMDWKPDILGDCTDLSLFASQSFDAVFSSHLLEHIEDTEKTLREWWRVIKQDGYLVLYLPHKRFYPNIGERGSNPDHKHDFVPNDIIGVMQGVGKWDLVVNEERGGNDEYSFLQVYKKISRSSWMYSYFEGKPPKTCAVVRYGGIGDMIQTSSILPGLKEQGYHVTLMTTPDGYNIIKNDPNVDDFYIQDNDQVPMHELGKFWDVVSKKYDKFINLTETVEVALLVSPTMTCHKWPQEVRHKRFDFNYIELTHAVAQVPMPPMFRFYPSVKEEKIAHKYKKKIASDFVISWVLSGSSVHKAWPYLDQAIARTLVKFPGVKIVLMGDTLSQALETGWENEPRVIRKCGRWNVRETLSFARISDMVIGPETGVMNAVGLEPMPKILTLSHSSPENISKHWTNTIALEPKDCECHPCHQLNTSFNECERSVSTGTAICQAKIDIEAMWNAIVYHMERIEVE